VALLDLPAMSWNRAAQGSPNLPSYEGDPLDGNGGVTLANRLEFVVRATKRHRTLVGGILGLGLVVLATYYLTQTPHYRVTTTLLAQRQQAVPSIVRSAVPSDLPTRGAYELIQRRENLVALLKQTGIYKEGAVPAAPGWMERIRLAVGRVFDSSPTPEDPLNILVQRLKRNLFVETGDGTVSITVDWTDPQQAYQLVEAALQNYLEARQLQEITAIDDAITLLQGRVSTLRQELDAAISGSRTTVTVPSPAASADAAARAAAARGPAPVNEGLAVLKAQLDAKERALRDMEDLRRRRLADAQAQLDEKRGVYSDAHPSVVALRNEVDSLSRESPQLAALREEEHLLREDYNARLAAENQAQAQVPLPRAARAPGTRQVVVAPGQETEAVRDARFRYQQMVERLNAAQLDLDSARAAFKYRYSVVWPAEVPRRPVSPNPLKVFGLGGLGLLVLAPLAAAWLEHRSGRVLTRWQAEAALDLPVLAEVHRRR
jgi:uncharacterized protein involved in exopolysaccharide biosynthesis